MDTISNEAQKPKRTRSRSRKKIEVPAEAFVERRTVRVDTETFAVYPETGRRRYEDRIGTVVELVTNDGARTPSGGKFTSRRLTVRLRGDDRRWVGQFKNGEKTHVILRPLAR
jgi:hypothetical protein